MTKGVPASPSGHSRAEPEEVSALRASVPNANDLLVSDGGIMACAQFIGVELAPILRERGLWNDERDPLDKLRDMASLSNAALNAVHLWTAKVAAIATEAHRAATVKQGAVHEGAGRRHRPKPLVGKEEET